MKSLLFSTIVILITIVGIIINGSILIVIILTKQIKSANHILLFHLGTIDICIGLLFLAFFIPGTHGKEWIADEIPCLVHGFFFTLLQPLVLWTICGLNCDRFYLIAVPLHYSRIVTSKKVLLAVGGIWITSIVLSTPPVFKVVPFSFVPRLGYCEPHITSDPVILWYSTVYVAITMLLPAIFIIYSNVKIFTIARYHRHRIASAIFQVAISAQVAITHQKNPFSVSFGRVATPPPPGPKFHSAIYNLFQFAGSFIILYMPYYSIIILESTMHIFSNSDSTKSFYEIYLKSNFYEISSSLLILTIPINGFLYGVKSKQLKQVLKNYWRKMQTTHDLNQEIQARTPSTCGSRRPSFLVKPENMVDVHKILKSSPFATPNSLSPSTLQVPSNNIQGVSLITEDEICLKLKSTKKSSAYKFLHNIFAGDDYEKSRKKYIPLNCSFQKTYCAPSPKIVLTKAVLANADDLETSLDGGMSSSFKPLLGNVTNYSAHLNNIS